MITIQDKDGEDVHLVSKYEVCPRCHGHGKHVNPNVDGHGITEEERDRDWSYEEWQGYLNGEHDVTCWQCKGLRVVMVPDESANPQELLDLYEEQQEDDRQYERMCQMERMMGA